MRWSLKQVWLYIMQYINVFFITEGAVVVVVDRMVVRFTITLAISAYHHWSCEFKSNYGKVYLIQHYVIKFVSDLRQVGGFLRILRFPPPIKLTPHNLTEKLLKSYVKHHKPNPIIMYISDSRIIVLILC